MSIKNNKTAIELLSLIAALMDEDDLEELLSAMSEAEEPEDEPTLCNDHCFECPDRDTCPESPLYLGEDDEDDIEPDPVCCDDDCDNCSACYSCGYSPFYREDDEDEDEEPEDDALTIEITIPDGMPCIVMGGTDDELPLAMELIKEMGLVSPAPAPAPKKSRVRGEMVNRNQSVPEGSISGRALREMIERAVEAAKEPAEGSAAWLDKYHY